jgi:hypothetical protein
VEDDGLLLLAEEAPEESLHPRSRVR